MESLSNIYIVEVLDEMLKPTEEGCKLCNIELENAIDLLPLPYHKRAIEEFFHILKML